MINGLNLIFISAKPKGFVPTVTSTSKMNFNFGSSTETPAFTAGSKTRKSGAGKENSLVTPAPAVPRRPSQGSTLKARKSFGKLLILIQYKTLLQIINRTVINLTY